MKKPSQIVFNLSVLIILFALLSTDCQQQATLDIDEILDIDGGLIVHIGCDDGRLTARLHKNENYVVHGLDMESAKVDRSRKHIQSLGIYGKVSVDRFDGIHLPYIDNFVNLVLAADLGSVSMEEVQRVLVPNGTAYWKEDGEWQKITKPWPSEMDEWTHSLHGPDNNPVAEDSLVAPPVHMQWICEPAWSKHHEKYPPTIPALVSSAGRVFYFEDETPPSFFNVKTKWSLVARDAFNGIELWRRPVPNWLPEQWPGDLGGGLSGGPSDYRKRLISIGDKLYGTLGHSSPVTEVDARTGQTLRTFCQGADHVELFHADDRLYVVTGAERNAPDQISMFDVSSGQQIWQAKGGKGTALKNGHLYFLSGEELVALDAETGDQAWRSAAIEQFRKKTQLPARRVYDSGPLRVGDRVILTAPVRGILAAFSTGAGELLWTYENEATHTGSRGLEAWFINELVWVPGASAGNEEDRMETVLMGLEPTTGEVQKTVPAGPVFNTGHHRRCYPGKATEDFLIFSRRGAEFLDLDSGDIGLNNWTRGTCGYGVMPSNGLLYSPPHSCRCYSEAALRGLTALAPSSRGPSLTFDKTSKAERLEEGPAFGEPIENNSRDTDWPTYRHDFARSGSSKSKVPLSIEKKWQTRIGGRISQPVVAEGRLFVSAVDTHTIHAFSVSDGRPNWTFTAGGRIDSPPTIHKGRVFFGSTDGWVYCLRASDGELIWRFRAAPVDLRMGAYGQVESVWPIHGSVLVQDDAVYFAAGRSSFLDGGIYLHGLDIKSGDPLYEYRQSGPWLEAGKTSENPNPGFVMPGSLPDILVSDGKEIFMRHMAFDPALLESRDTIPNLYIAPERTGENFGGDHKYWCDLLEVGPRAFIDYFGWDYRSYFNNFPGKRLYSTVGLLDDSWHVRSYWSYGQVVGQQIVFEGNRGYAVRAYPNAARWAFFEAGNGYQLYSGNTDLPDSEEKLYALKEDDHLWTTRLPFRPRGMILADETLWIAGPPDPGDPSAALEALQGSLGSRLAAINTDNGDTVAAFNLDSIPVFDGLVTADGMLFIALIDGTLVCLG